MLTIRRFRTICRHSPILLEAFFWMGIARFVILTLPFRWVEPYLRQSMTKSPMDVRQDNTHQLNMVSWAVNKMACYTPWKSNCLVKAMAAKRMLQSRNIVSTLYLGVMRSNSQPLEAHAWLRSGSIYLTGGQGHKKFTVVGMFAEEGE